MARYQKSARCSRAILFSLTIGTLSSVGCANMQSQSQPTQVNKTGIGAATGAALGAVGGAIIGSATGDAGEGLVIGSVTGAVAGGVIGHGLDQQGREMVAQRETIVRQSEQIQQQQAELNELRRGARDGALGEGVRFQPSTTGAAYGGARPSSITEENISSPVQPRLDPGNSNSAWNLPPAQGHSGQGYFGQGQAGAFEISEKNRSSAELAAAGTMNAVSSSAGGQPVDLSELRAEARANARSEIRSRLGAPAPSGGTRLINPGHRESQDEELPALHLQAAQPAGMPTAALGSAQAPITTASALPAVDELMIPPSVKLDPPKASSAGVRSESIPPAKAASGLPSAKSADMAKAAPVVDFEAPEEVSAIPEAPAEAKDADVTEGIPVVSVVQSKNTNDDLTPKDSNCVEGEAEAERARNATSDADKLFYYRRALRQCPKEPVYRIEIGRVYAGIGRSEDARFEFTKALELDPENETAQDELSMIMLENQNNAY